MALRPTTKGKKFLKAENYVDKPTEKGIITDIKDNQKQGKNGEYWDKTIFFKIDENVYELKYIFDISLNKMVERYGENTEDFIGKSVILTATKNESGYFDWVFNPAEEYNQTLIVEKEEVK